MKLILIILTLMCNACIGQNKDSIPNHVHHFEYRSLPQHDLGNGHFCLAVHGYYLPCKCGERWGIANQIEMDKYTRSEVRGGSGVTVWKIDGNGYIFQTDTIPYTNKVIDSTFITWDSTIDIRSNEVKEYWDSVYNRPPIALAGVDQIITPKTKTVKLKGIGYDVDGTIVKYNWKQINGDKCIIKNPTSKETIVTGISGWGFYIFQLTVTDNKGDTDKDNVMIKVKYF